MIEEALKDKTEYESILTEYTRELRNRSDESKIKELSKLRNIDIAVLEEAEVFYIGEMAEMIIPRFSGILSELGVISPTNNKPIFHNRWIFPIKTVDSTVQNLVGYSNTADERYIYGKSRYYLRRDTLFGLENFPLAYELGWAIVVEGITDALSLRCLGIKNVFAMCGTHKSDKIMTMLNRLRHGVIFIPDRDEAGDYAKRHWRTYRSITLNVHFQYKDIDEMLREEENRDLVMEYIRECAKYLLSREHIGYTCDIKELTIL
jgi:DNA primase